MKFLLLWTLFMVAFSSAYVTKLTELEISEWKNFKEKFVRSYDTEEEEESRKMVFMSNLKFVLDHNKKFKNKEVAFEVGINQFADMTNEEFKLRMNGYRPEFRKKSATVFKKPENLSVPDSVDWREKGAVTAIKNQGSCGSCWAFSTTGSIEGQYYLNTSELVSLSEQNLIDCSDSYGNEGCGGGMIDYAFEYVVQNNGIDTNNFYPYTGKKANCSFNTSHTGATISSWVDITSGSEDDLMAAVGLVGPVSAAIDASPLSFQLYKSGVYHGMFCSSSYLDHAVLVVGYGKKDGVWWWDGEYWLVKNSWGTSWGEEGYIRIARNDKNKCGVATRASYPVV